MKRHRMALNARRLCAPVLMAAGLAACANEPPPPTAQIGASTQAIASAEQAGALRYAPAALQTARDKLAQAQAAVRADDHVRARRLAEEAQVEAELASVKAQSEAAQVAASAVRRNTETLREESSGTSR